MACHYPTVGHGQGLVQRVAHAVIHGEAPDAIRDGTEKEPAFAVGQTSAKTWVEPGAKTWAWLKAHAELSS